LTLSARESAELWGLIKIKLIDQQLQPEFNERGPGRPRGRLNKILAKTDNKETLRKRRSRRRTQEMQDDMLINGLQYEFPSPDGIKVVFVKPTHDPDPPVVLKRDKY
jgi:hypothetical protein